METIVLQCNGVLKIKNGEETLDDFYQFLPKFVHLIYSIQIFKKNATEYISICAKTYMGEQYFQKWNTWNQNIDWPCLTNIWESILKIGTNNIQPQFEQLLAEKRQLNASY